MAHSTHHFEVRVSGRVVDVAEVSAASVGLNESGKPETTPIVLRRALEQGALLFAWWKNSLEEPSKRPTVRIALLAANGKPVIAWTLRETRAVRWSAPALDALEGVPAMEELHLVYRSVEVTAP